MRKSEIIRKLEAIEGDPEVISAFDEPLTSVTADRVGETVTIVLDFEPAEGGM